MRILVQERNSQFIYLFIFFDKRRNCNGVFVMLRVIVEDVCHLDFEGCLEALIQCQEVYFGPWGLDLDRFLIFYCDTFGIHTSILQKTSNIPPNLSFTLLLYFSPLSCIVWCFNLEVVLSIVYLSSFYLCFYLLQLCTSTSQGE